MLENQDEPYLVDVIVEVEKNAYPMIPAGGSDEDIIMNEGNLSPEATATQICRARAINEFN